MADDWRLTDAEISSLIYALDYPHTDEDVARDIAEAQGLKALEWAERRCVLCAELYKNRCDVEGRRYSTDEIIEICASAIRAGAAK